MPENDNGQQGNTQPTFNPSLDNFSGTQFERDVHIIAQSLLKQHPDLNTLRNSTRQSQSSVSTNHNWTFGRNGLSGRSRSSSGGILGDFEDGIRDELLRSITGGNFRRGMQSVMNEFTKKFGIQLRDLPYEYGKHLGKLAADTKLGKQLTGKLQNLAGGLLERVFGKGNASSIIQAFKTGAGGGGGQLGANFAQGGMNNPQLTQLFGKMDKYFTSGGGAAVGAAVAVFYIAMKPFLQGIGDFIKAWGKALNREEDSRKKRLENAQKRMQADMEYLVKAPFEILENAAKKWEETWDSNLAKISLTQGYNKESTYALYSQIAEQLNADGLGSVIAATDVVNNLSKVLDTGLSGAVAQAFAYESTILSAAMPTEDFTSYAATYAQVATDAMNSGLSQAEAVDYANLQLEEFASNLLYSSRTLSGGFSTGLKDAQSLFKDAVEIAQTAKTHNVSEISGTLTSVSAIIGAVAPDLAQGLVQNVVSAAVGGNNSSIVALRSLAGINAGNTEFLRQMANDPQKVFVNIFRSLANMQNMSPANYMEVAEGLADVFGVDMKAFARVDFNNLADKISQMQVNQASLEENIKLLQSGEATMSTEQLKIQEINNVILEEGLAYVIDSEAGRMIQQNMWEEQRANALMENEYAVNLQGSALSLLEGMRHTIANILSFLNPIGWVADKVAQLYVVDQERKENTRQIADILERGAVGSNHIAFGNLTNTSGQDLHLVPSLIEMMGGTNYKNAYKNMAIQAVDIISGIANPAGAVISWLAGDDNFALNGPTSWNRAVDAVGGMDALFGGFLGAPGQTYFSPGLSVQSLYSGFNVGKSTAALLSGSLNSATYTGSPLTQSATAQAFAANKEALQSFINSAATAAGTMTLEQYLGTAAQYGIANVEDALDDYGMSMEDLRNYFEGHQSGIGGTEKAAREQNIQDFIEENRGFWDYSAGVSGVFQTAMWIPFFGDGQKYDTRMDAVDLALTSIQDRIGDKEKHTVISGIEELSDKLGDNSTFTVLSVLGQIESEIRTTFVDNKSRFQECLADWTSYIASKSDYSTGVRSSGAWSELKQAEGDRQNETLLALANAMNVFSADELQKLDPQLQANALLGEIVILLQTIMQQNNTQAGGLGLIDTISALGLGMTTRQ